MRRKKKLEYTFDHEQTKIVYRNKSGRFTRKRKNARRFEYQILWVRDSKNNLRRYGQIRAKGKRPLVKLNTVNESKVKEGIFIKGVLEERGAIKELMNNGARGVEINVSGRSRGKERRVKSRIIFDRSRLEDAGYLAGIVSGRVQSALAAAGLRVSHHSISKRKGLSQLKRVNFSIHFFY